MAAISRQNFLAEVDSRQTDPLSQVAPLKAISDDRVPETTYPVRTRGGWQKLSEHGSANTDWDLMDGRSTVNSMRPVNASMVTCFENHSCFTTIEMYHNFPWSHEMRQGLSRQKALKSFTVHLVLRGGEDRDDPYDKFDILSYLPSPAVELVFEWARSAFQVSAAPICGQIAEEILMYVTTLRAENLRLNKATVQGGRASGRPTSVEYVAKRIAGSSEKYEEAKRK
ncbi:hypothetical protein HPB50_019168 [Hyalomma asiaticum]|uniref:Uncharacterized protein n=1 Tax=Hyalomma asiaticum TaxID=266040 RepID=A0ACB7TAW8_HYAAI|nr:hypothetical protein HPB50_019168 [Hyalomma asiaticum]